MAVYTQRSALQNGLKAGMTAMRTLAVAENAGNRVVPTGLRSFSITLTQDFVLG